MQGLPVRPVILGVVVLQVALPVTMLVDRWVDEGTRAVTERPASFQMYSATARPAYTGTDALGRRRTLDLSSLPLPLRALDTGSAVPDRLCRRHPDLAEVERTGGADPGVFRC